MINEQRLKKNYVCIKHWRNSAHKFVYVYIHIYLLILFYHYINLLSFKFSKKKKRENHSENFWCISSIFNIYRNEANMINERNICLRDIASSMINYVHCLSEDFAGRNFLSILRHFYKLYSCLKIYVNVSCSMNIWIYVYIYSTMVSSGTKIHD